MNKKIYYSSWVLGGVVFASAAIVMTTSCSRISLEQQKKDANLIKPLIEAKKINIVINKSSIKLTDFDKNGFIKINLELLKDHGITNEEYLKEVQDAIKRSYIAFDSYLLPILNRDSETTLIFKINNIEEIKLKISDLISSETSKSVTLNNLTAEEIKNVIEQKLNKDINFKTSTITFLSTALEDKWKMMVDENKDPNINLDFARWWNGTGVNFVKYEYEKYLYRTYPNYFSENDYQNLNVEVWNTNMNQNGEAIVEQDKIDPNKKYVYIKLGISTYKLAPTPTPSPQEAANAYYEFTIKIPVQVINPN